MSKYEVYKKVIFQDRNRVQKIWLAQNEFLIYAN